MAKKGHCKNHPEKETARRCFYCKEYICSACQQKHEHHLFCSRSHYYRWKAEQILVRLKPYRAWIFIVLFIILSDILLYALLKQKAPVSPPPAAPADTIAVVDSSWIKMDTTHTAFDYGLQIKIKMEGKARPVLLWKNGVFQESRKPKNGLLDFGTYYFSSGANRFSLWTMDDKGQSSLVDSFTVQFNSARLDFLAKPLSRVYTSEKKLALTFDGGSAAKGTLHILDTLKSRNLKCTLFLTGDFIKRYPALVRRMIADGHELGNHSMHHPHLTNLEIDGSSKSRSYVNRRYIKKELSEPDSLFYILSGIHLAPLWRAPFGELNRDILRWAAEAGWKHTGWSLKCDSWDWVADSTSQLYRTPQEIVTHFEQLENKQGLNGRILLMHLSSERKKDFPYTVLGRLIDSLRSRGYRFVTVSRLLTGEKAVAAK